MKIKKIIIKDFVCKGKILEVKINSKGFVVTGLNGSGKTVLLNFINALYTKDVSTLLHLPFSEAEIILENKEKFLVERKLKYTSELFSKLSSSKVKFFEESFKFEWLSQEKLKKLPSEILVKYLNKKKRVLKSGETVFENEDGKFQRYDELSAGEAKIIRYIVAAQIEDYDILIMDLPENGLSLNAQSKLINDLYRKNIQLMISTHAPYIFEDMKAEKAMIVKLS